LSFEPNRGQFEGPARFVGLGPGYRVSLSPREATLDLGRPQASAQPVRVRMTLVGGNPASEMRGGRELESKSHYFSGSDPQRWHRNVPNYRRVEYPGVYPGIDLFFHGEQGELEYDFVLAPGADPGQIRLRFEGGRRIRLEGNGDLVIETAAGDVRQRKPVLYQEIKGERRSIGGRYTLHGRHEVGFRVASYDASRSLVIDPVVVYSTYYGGCRGRQGINDVAVDAAGNAYAVGNYPWDCDRGSPQAYVAKFSPEGTRLAGATFGGWFGDAPTGVALDASGNVYVTGWSEQVFPGPPQFPTTANALQPGNAGGRDAFVTKFDPTLGSILYSTLLGGTGDDVGADLEVDASATAYVAGRTTSLDFPTASASQPVLAGGQDAFVAALDATGSALVYSSYLGGSGDETVARLARMDSSVVVAGATSSTDLEARTADPAGPFQPSFGGGTADAFVARYCSAGQLEYLTYLGGSGRDEAYGVATDAFGFAYVTGGTSSPDYPTAAALQPSLSFPPEADAFVTKLAPTGGSLAYSTYLQVGGDVAECFALGSPLVAAPCGGIAVGPGGEAHVTAKRVFAVRLDASGTSRTDTFNGFGGNAIALGGGGECIVSGRLAFSPPSQLYPTVNAFRSQLASYEDETGTLARITEAPNPNAAVEQDDPRIAYTGAWETVSSAEASGGSLARSAESGAKAVLTFDGTGIQLIGRRDASSGIVRVSLDQDPFRQNLGLDTYASPAEPRSLLVSFSGLNQGQHTLVLEVAGAHGGRSAGSWVTIDGFSVLGAPAPGPSRAPTPLPSASRTDTSVEVR
jgi:hypothetical protein